MTPKQEAFVREYLVDLNASAAYLRAGYKTGNANVLGPRMLANAGIGQAIQKEMDERAKRVQITADYVLTTIRDTVERCRQAEPVLDKEGHPTGEYRFDSTAVLRGAELLGKHLKLFTDKTEVTGKDGAALGGVLLCPAPMNAEQWEATVATQQAALLKGAGRG